MKIVRKCPTCNKVVETKEQEEKIRAQRFTIERLEEEVDALKASVPLSVAQLAEQTQALNRTVQRIASLEDQSQRLQRQLQKRDRT